MAFGGKLLNILCSGSRILSEIPGWRLLRFGLEDRMKKKVAIIFGGQSSEHEVSCISATTIIENINRDTYDPVLIGIRKDGRWLKVDSAEAITDGSWRDGKVTAVISPDREQHGVIFMEDGKAELVKLDYVFPVLHGLYGEDGTVQGLVELAGIPYVGCGVLASAVSMDKLYTKIIVDTLGICQAAYVPVMSYELTDMDKVVEKVLAKLSFPVFVKPSNAGSSQGVNKAHDREELVSALTEAAKHDRKILVEETIVGREIECAVLGNGRDVEASGLGEILAADEFYSYDAKYYNAESKTVLGPELPIGVTEEIREDARKIFRAVDGFGLSRVDFFYDTVRRRVVFNEINTLPGFTSISMYPMLWEKEGFSKELLIDKLLDMAKDR